VFIQTVNLRVQNNHKITGLLVVIDRQYCGLETSA